MRNLSSLEKYRKFGNDACGKFIIPSENKRFKYQVIASVDGNWDHISVSLMTWNEQYPLSRCPKWDEMCFIKDLFFEDEEEVIQFHPKKSEYVNIHPYVLHLWKYHGEMIKPLM